MKRTVAFSTLVLILALALPVSAFAGGQEQGRVILGGTYTLDRGETLHGDLAIVGGSAFLESGSTVQGNVILVGGNLEARGEITGNLYVLGGSGDLGPDAVIGGNVGNLGGSIDVGNARIEGDRITWEELEFTPDFDFDWVPSWQPISSFGFSTGGRVRRYLFNSFVLAALAVLAMIFFPIPTKRVSAAIMGQPVAAGGLGLLTAIVAPILLVMLAITICLAPVSLIALLALIVAFVFGWVALGVEVGRRLADALDQEFQPVVEAGLGTLILALVVNGVGLIPCVGWVASFLVAIFGLGGVILTRYGTYDYVAAAGLSAPSGEAAIVEVPPPDEPEKKAPAKSAKKSTKKSTK
jgi:hypothetical protein